MKKLITICLLTVTTFSVRSQESKPALSFEETVEYINTKNTNNGYVLRPGYSIGESYGAGIRSIRVIKSGRIEFYLCCDWPIVAFNLFDLTKEIYIDEKDRLVFEFSSTEKKEIKTKSLAETERLKKAFSHLISLCTKEKDPF